jgi:hypothetical protein
MDRLLFNIIIIGMAAWVDRRRTGQTKDNKLEYVAPEPNTHRKGIREYTG